jgi:hypothetical protein
MVRLITWLIGLTLGAIVAIGLLLFTETGNQLFTPTAQRLLQIKLPQAQIEQLSIRLDHVDLRIALTPTTQLTINAMTAWLSAKAMGSWQFQTQELAELSPLTNLALSGPLRTQGTFVLAPAQQEIDGDLALAKSKLTFFALHPARTPLTIVTSGQLSLSELTQLLKQPDIASGTLSVDSRLSMANTEHLNTLNGTAKLTINDGLVHAKAIQQAYDMNLPKDLPFTFNNNTDILEGNSRSQLHLDNPLATIDINDLDYEFGHDGFTAAHHTHIPDLSALAFITRTLLHGQLQVDGKATYTIPTKYLELSADSQTLGGRITSTLNGDQLDARLDDLQTTDMAKLLGMPVVFKSSLAGIVNYNLSQQQGKFDVTLVDGQLLPNEFSTLLNQAAKFDITREVYERVSSNGSIKQGVVLANLDMKSKLTHLTSQNARIDLPNQQLDMKLIADVQGIVIPVQLQGALTSPSIHTELGNALKQGAEKAAQQAIDKEKASLSDKLTDKLKQLNLPTFGH